MTQTCNLMRLRHGHQCGDSLGNIARSCLKTQTKTKQRQNQTTKNRQSYWWCSDSEDKEIWFRCAPEKQVPGPWMSFLSGWSGNSLNKHKTANHFKPFWLGFLHVFKLAKIQRLSRGQTLYRTLAKVTLTVISLRLLMSFKNTSESQEWNL